jgi:hypothetical protein
MLAARVLVDDHERAEEQRAGGIRKTSADPVPASCRAQPAKKAAITQVSAIAARTGAAVGFP